MRIVLDSSVVVAALTTPNTASASRVVLAAAAAGAIQFVITDEIEAEYRRAVEYQRVARYAAKVDRQAFVSMIVATADRVKAEPAIGVVPDDPGDDMVMGAAFAGRVEFVVSLDQHLLRLKKLRGIAIVKPGDLLREMRLHLLPE